MLEENPNGTPHVSCWIVEFTNGWWLRGGVATTDMQRASRYAYEKDARKALAQARHNFKAKDLKAAKVKCIRDGVVL
jgi:hypothetical protein